MALRVMDLGGAGDAGLSGRPQMKSGIMIRMAGDRPEIPHEARLFVIGWWGIAAAASLFFVAHGAWPVAVALMLACLGLVHALSTSRRAPAPSEMLRVDHMEICHWSSRRQPASPPAVLPTLGTTLEIGPSACGGLELRLRHRVTTLDIGCCLGPSERGELARILSTLLPAAERSGRS